MSHGPPKQDPAMQALEDQIHRSQFQKWDVETFLADRHRAKIEALTNSDDKWAKRRQVGKEIATTFFAFVGQVSLIAMAGAYLLTGNFIP